MKILKLFSVIFLLACALYSNAQTTFSYTGTIQTWTVPAGATMLTVTVNAAAGGSTYYSSGGCGGRVTAQVAVTPGQVINVFVGNQGGDATFYGPGAGGNTGNIMNVGGDGGNSPYTGGAAGGGGSSDIRIGGIGLANRVVAAGGGGGAGNDPCMSEPGGHGGGAATAASGEHCGGPSTTTCGQGATPAAGGAAATAGGTAGASLFGGDGTSLVYTYYGYWGTYYYYSTSAGGGGGAGYFGGGGGSAGGGGGGSSWVDPALTSSVVHTAGPSCGDGSVIIDVLCTPPVGGAIVGPSTACMGAPVTYTNPTGTAGGTWSSSAPGTFTVNPTTGAVTVLASGSGTLTYSITNPCGSASTSTPIIAAIPPSPIAGPLTVCELGSNTLTDPDAGGTWTSINTAVATIDPFTGLYSSLAAGTTTISYTIGSCAATAVLTVNPNPPAIAGPGAVCQGGTITLTNSVPGGIWSSNLPTGASVDAITGVVSGILAGATARIDYTLPTTCFSFRFVTVNTPPDPITGPTQTCQGTAFALANAIPGGIWSSGTPAVATISSAGIVSGLTGGTSLIAYTMPGCPPATYSVTINPGPAPITGRTAICTGLATPLSSATPGGTWTSSNPSIIVTPTTGLVTSSAIGSSGTIYYTLPTGCFTSVVVNVNLGAPAMVGPTNICKGETATFTDADPTGIWSSTNLSIAQIIDTSGVVTGISAGIVDISYTLPNGCFAVQPLSVDPLIPGVVNISRYPSGIICQDDTVWMVATPVAGGGSMPAFTWKKFSVTLPGATDDTLVYVAHTPSSGLHGDVFNVFMYPNDGCPMYDSVADSIYMDVAPKDVHPTVFITTTGPDTVAFMGQTVTFFTNLTWGGPSPTYQWFKNNVAIPGANGSTYSTTIYGDRDFFHCEVIGNPPCMDTVKPLGLGVSNKITIYNFLSVNDLPTGNGALSLFPNPNAGTFTLSGKLGTISNNDVHFEITNMLGQVIYNGQTTPKNGEISTTIKLDNIVPGSYLLQVNTDTGMETFHFVIAK
ncbi:MAG: surface protein [Flavipsychrobacter sp.]|jgi:uncharacterized protein YjdB|nr:surface protein [Flavipsychrobacter sp.]